VVYLICFDLSEPFERQCEQVGFWLNFLNSALPLPPNKLKSDDMKWVLLLVGLKQDQQTTSVVQLPHLEAWAKLFPRLPIVPRLFYTSSIASTESVVELKHAIEEHCDRIFSKHTAFIPVSYQKLLEDLRGLHSQSTIHCDLIFQKYSHGLTHEGLTVALQYLHAIGRIVLLKSGLVFPDPKVVTQITAKFVSPEYVQASLLAKEGVQILNEKQIGCLLDIGNGCKG
jgi:hypothetical protein